MTSVRSQQMKASLQERFVPAVRDLGFKGTFPNFWRVTGDWLDLVSVQFSMAGDGFFVNLATCKRPDSDSPQAKRLRKPEAVRVADLFGSGERLGKDRGGFFGFSTLTATTAKARGHDDEVAARATRCLQTEAEPWWKAQRRKKRPMPWPTR